jgi:hypothetical protein
MQMKGTERFHFTLVRMAIIKRKNNKYWWGCEGKRDLYILLAGMQISAATMEKNMEVL